MGEIIDFPSNDGPRPFRPNSAVRQYQASEKCDAVISFRIPREAKRYLMAEAYESNDMFSHHVASIVLEHANRQGLHCIRLAGRKEEREERAA